MSYSTLFHFVTQLSKRSLLSFGGAPFVWQGGLEFLAMCGFWKLFWLDCNGVVKFSGLDV